MKGKQQPSVPQKEMLPLFIFTIFLVRPAKISRQKFVFIQRLYGLRRNDYQMLPTYRNVKQSH